jgi:virulence factor Mce-like protein
MTGPLAGLRTWLAVASASIFLAAVAFVVVVGGGSTKTVSAQFAEAPGLYPGNHVDVLGIPVGAVTGVKAEAGYVLVTMQVRSSLKIPTGASAVIMAPTVVADRFVELSPSYTGGSTLPPGSVIPLNRTAIPQSVDAVYAALNSLAYQLGPNGVNKTGALTDVVHRLAVQFGDAGPDFKSAIVNVSGALHGFAQNSTQLTDLLNNLGNLSKALASNSGTYTSFTANLAAVSQILANDRSDLASVLSSLQQLFANLTAFIEADGPQLGASISNLRTFASSLVSQQQSLAKALDLSPLSLQNLDNAIDKSAPGGPALRGRYDAVAATQQLFNQVCGNSALRFLVILATGTQTNPLTVATPVDTLCGIGNALNALTPPPGASPGPNMTLAALTS